MSFELRDVTLNETQQKFIQRHLHATAQLAAVLSFSDNRVYDRPQNIFDGVIAISGPELSYHLFRNAGLTHKYMGSVSAESSTLRYSDDITAALKQLHPTLQTDVIDMIGNVHQAMMQHTQGAQVT